MSLRKPLCYGLLTLDQDNDFTEKVVCTLVTTFNATSVCLIWGSGVLREHAYRISRYTPERDLTNVLRVTDEITHPIFETYLYSNITIDRLDNLLELTLEPTMYTDAIVNFMLYGKVPGDNFIEGYSQSVYVLVG